MAGAALQGLLRANKQQFRWDFEGGEMMLGAFLDCVEAWSKSVEEQLLSLCAPTPKWNQADAALELLCVGAAIAGKIKPEATAAEMIEGAFSNWQPDCASTAREMESLYKTLVQNRDKIVSTARSQMSSMKGGQVGAMLNPARVMGAVRGIRRAKWRLHLEPSVADRNEIAKIYRDIQAALPAAAEAEMLLRQTWLTEMEDAFGKDSSRATIVSSLDTARQAAFTAGVGANNTFKMLQDALQVFQSVYFDDSVAAARSLSKQDDGLAALPYFGRGRRNAVEAGTGLANAARRFLDSVDENFAAYGETHTAKHSARTSSLQQIDVSLQTIENDLLEIGETTGTHDAA
jgi:hypothetical protein